MALPNRKILVTFLALCWNLSLLGQDETMQFDKLPPILNYVPENELMSLIEAEFNLQHVGENIPSNGRRAAKQYREVKKNYKGLIARADSAELSTFHKFFEDALQVYAYYISTDYLGKAKARINQLREIIYKLGEWVYLKETDADKRLNVQILYLAHGLGQPAYLADSISKIIEKDKNAPENFVNPIKLLLYFNLNRSPSTAGSAKMILDQVAGKLTTRQQVIVDLIALQNRTVGEEDVGQTDISPAQNRNILLDISRKAQRIKELGLRWRVNSTILDLWLRMNKSIDWRNAPLIEIESKSGIVITPILERIVIEEIASGNLSKGIKTYKALSKAFRSQIISIQLDNRYLSLSIKFAKKTSDYEFLDRIYYELVTRYQKPNSRFNKPARKAYVAFFLGYNQYIQSLLEQGLSGKLDTKAKIRIANIAKKFTSTFASARTQILKNKELLAKLYENLKKYKEAVTEYLDLTKEDPLNFYEKASHPQKILASWPESPPWGKIGRGSKAERLHLIKIYEALVSAQKDKDEKVNWVDLAHLGLLYGVTGQITKAEDLWAPEIKNASPSPHVNGASGILLAFYYRQKKWDQFINLARTAENKKILPTLEQQVLDMKKFYKIALVQRSQESIRESKWKAAIADYEEVVSRYPKEPNRPALLAEIGRLYVKSKDILGGMTAIKKLLTEYPNSAQTKKSLLEAGAWGSGSKDAKVLAEAANFYKWYLENFTNDPNVPKARFECAKIYIMLKQYPQASGYLKDHALDRRVNVPDRVRAALMHINLEDKYGERERAIASLVPVIRMVKPNFGDDLNISAHVILARVATEKVNIQQMKIEEKILAPHISRRLDVADALGYLRLSMANHFEYEIPFPNEPHGIDTFRPTIDKIFKAFRIIQDSYERICLARENRYCEPAYGRLKQFSQDALDAIAAVELVGKIQPKMLKVLKEYQQNILQEVREEKQKFDRLFDKYRIANERKEFN